MPIHSLVPRCVERVWGITDLPIWAPGVRNVHAPIGEIWFEEADGADRELLVKLLFTSERLSIQVHPDDTAARAIGYTSGKDEAWLVLDAEPEAVIGLGLRHTVTKVELRAAAVSGEIERLIDWRPVKSGDIYYSPAGTVHAIGAGLTIMEIQQNLDLTYRLYDYGRPRDLHLEEGIEAADPRPWRPDFAPRDIAPDRELLHEGGAFVIERWLGDAPQRIDANDSSILVIPVRDGGRLDGEVLRLGTVVRVEGRGALDGDRNVIAAYSGDKAQSALLA